MSTRRKIALAISTLMLLLAGWLVYVAWLVITTGGTEVPPASALPSVPADAVQVSNYMGCGSGGCWKELRLRPAPGTRSEDLVATLGLGHTQCRRDNWPDPRATCVGATVHSDGVVLVFAQYRWW